MSCGCSGVDPAGVDYSKPKPFIHWLEMLLIIAVVIIGYGIYKLLK